MQQNGLRIVQMSSIPDPSSTSFFLMAQLQDHRFSPTPLNSDVCPAPFRVLTPPDPYGAVSDSEHSVSVPACVPSLTVLFQCSGSSLWAVAGAWDLEGHEPNSLLLGPKKAFLLTVC